VKKIKVLIPLVLFFLIFSISTEAVSAAPRLYLDPAEGSYDVNSSFEVEVNINTDGQSVVAVDAIINYDAAKLRVDSISDGGADHFFSDVSSDVSDGRISIYATPATALSEKTGTGMIARVSFTAIETGTASVSFLCETGSDLMDSNIWTIEGNDVIGCASNGSGSYTIGSGSGGETTLTSTPTPTPTTSAETTLTPTSTPTISSSLTSTATPTPSELPETGFDVPIAVLMLGGVIMLLLGVFAAI